MAKRPRLVVSHAPAHEEDAAPSDAPVNTDEQASPVRASERAGAPTHQLTLVHDADALARDIANIGKLAIARIKETLSKPFNAADPNYQALLRFTSGVYNSTMTTMLRADENLLRAGCPSCSNGSPRRSASASTADTASTCLPMARDDPRPSRDADPEIRR